GSSSPGGPNSGGAFSCGAVTRRTGDSTMNTSIRTHSRPATLVALVLLGTGLRSEPIRVSGGSPFAGCRTPPSFVNAEVEPAIASDPRHPNRLVAIYQQDRYHSGGARGSVIALSKNGGRAWRRVPLPLSRCAGRTARQAPFASDPWDSVVA